MKTLFANKETRTSNFEILTANELNVIKGGGPSRQDLNDGFIDSDAREDWGDDEDNF
ncbi:bacteriocin [Prolixibacteraceae bacterium JC049]|nr:bacteriocin [Prolixibacteraceae bacterium JC049]